MPFIAIRRLPFAALNKKEERRFERSSACQQPSDSRSHARMSVPQALVQMAPGEFRVRKFTIHKHPQAATISNNPNARCFTSYGAGRRYRDETIFWQSFETPRGISGALLTNRVRVTVEKFYRRTSRRRLSQKDSQVLAGAFGLSRSRDKKILDRICKVTGVAKNALAEFGAIKSTLADVFEMPVTKLQRPRFRRGR